MAQGRKLPPESLAALVEFFELLREIEKSNG